MNLTCETCGYTGDYGEVGQTAQCIKCDAVLDPRSATQDMRLHPDTLAAIRQGDRAGLFKSLETSETSSSAFMLDEPDAMSTDGVGLMTRPVIADKLAALEAFLDPGCGALFENEEYVTLAARIARASRNHGRPALADLKRMVDGFATRRAREVEQDIARALEARQIGAARSLFGLFQKMTEDAGAIRQVAGRLTEATRLERQVEEATAILADAREHGKTEQPTGLKQALKRYQLLIDGYGDHFPQLPVPFDLVKFERDRVVELLEQEESHQNVLSTAHAIATANEQIEDLFEIRKLYSENLESGRLDRRHVEEQIGTLTASIHKVLDKLVIEHLDEAAEAFEQPRYAEMQLGRLEAHRGRWEYLSATVQRRAEADYVRLKELVDRRAEVQRKSKAAQELIEQGRHAEAIRQLQMIAGLHGHLQVDVASDIEVAVGIIERRSMRLAERINDAFEDDALAAEDLERLMKKARAQADVLEELVEIAPQVATVADALDAAIRGGRRLAKSIARANRDIQDIRTLIMEGRRHEAKTLLGRVGEGLPAQCRDEVTQLKERLDVAIAVDDVVARLRRLMASDRPGALEWAMAHPDNPECRAFIARDRFDVAFREVLQFEEQGDNRAALGRAAEIGRSAPPDLEAFARAELERLTRVEQDAPRVQDILELARQAELEGRLEQVWTRFDEKLEVGRSLRNEWHRLRAAAINAASTSLRTKLEQALQVSQEKRARWSAQSGFDDEALFLKYGIQDVRRNSARVNLDAALEAIETVKLDAEFLRKRGREAIPRELVHLIDNVDIEARLCSVEDCLDRADFSQALALLPDEGGEPRLVRSRVRVERLEFCWSFMRAIQAVDEETARRLLSDYPVERAVERSQASELLKLLQSATAALSADDDDTSPRLDRLREALKMLHAAGHDESVVRVLAPLRARMEEALVQLVSQRFTEFERDRLPGSVFRQFELLRQLLMRDDLRARGLLDMQGLVAPRLQPGAEELLIWIERHRGALDRLPTGEIRDLQERLVLLGEAMSIGREADQRFSDASREIQAAWGRANEQKDARERRNALLDAAMAQMDMSLIRKAADLERDGDIADERAHQMLLAWMQAEKLIESIEGALSRNRFDELEAYLTQLERLDVPHRERATFRHPVIRGRSLSSGTRGIREVLDDLRAESRDRKEKRQKAVTDKERWMKTLLTAMDRIASECPTTGGETALRAHVDAAAPELLHEIRDLRAQLQALGAGSDAGDLTIDTVDALLQDLPPDEEGEFKAKLAALCGEFIADYDYLLKLSASASNLEVLKKRKLIEKIEARWRVSNAPSLVWLIRDLSRAWG